MSVTGEQKRNRYPKWKTLESNPDVINEFIYHLGVPREYRFSDCFGLDRESLAFVSLPCLAVLFLFPSGNFKHRDDIEQEDFSSETSNEVNPNIFFVKQYVPNACGTIAVVHAIANNLQHITLEDKPLKRFIAQCKDKTAEERGDLLGLDEEIAQEHSLSANQGQTRDDNLMRSDLHFCCFTTVDGSLYELDGRRRAPINHGKTSTERFLEDVALILKRNFIDRCPEEPLFSILTLGRISSLEEERDNDKERTPEKISEENVAQIIEMGFSREQALNALQSNENNIERAINYLLLTN